jgi:hypothetical protein
MVDRFEEPLLQNINVTIDCNLGVSGESRQHPGLRGFPPKYLRKKYALILGSLLKNLGPDLRPIFSFPLCVN